MANTDQRMNNVDLDVAQMAKDMERIRDKGLPHSTEAEMGVLSAMLLSPEARRELLRQVKPQDFYRQHTRTIFEAMAEMERDPDGPAVDSITLMEHLKATGMLDKAHGAETIFDLTGNTLSLASWPDYVKIMHEARRSREALWAGAKIMDMAADGKFSLTDAVSILERAVPARAPRSQDVINSLLGGTPGNPPLKTHKTGIAALDDAIKGFHPGDLVAVAGRASGGKTTMALDLAYTALESGASVVFCAVESDEATVWASIIARKTHVPAEDILNQTMTDAQRATLEEAREDISKLKLCVNPMARLTSKDVSETARDWFAGNKGDEERLVIVDSLQMLSPTENELTSSRGTQLSAAIRELKAVAKEMGATVITTAQLATPKATRATPYPAASADDMRETTSLVSACDTVITVDRSMTEEEALQPGRPDMNVAMVTVEKTRHGSLGKLFLPRDPATGSFLGGDQKPVAGTPQASRGQQVREAAPARFPREAAPDRTQGQGRQRATQQQARPAQAQAPVPGPAGQAQRPAAQQGQAPRPTGLTPGGRPMRQGGQQGQQQGQEPRPMAQQGRGQRPMAQQGQGQGHWPMAQGRQPSSQHAQAPAGRPAQRPPAQQAPQGWPVQEGRQQQPAWQGQARRQQQWAQAQDAGQRDPTAQDLNYEEVRQMGGWQEPTAGAQGWPDTFDGQGW